MSRSIVWPRLWEQRYRQMRRVLAAAMLLPVFFGVMALPAFAAGAGALGCVALMSVPLLGSALFTSYVIRVACHSLPSNDLRTVVLRGDRKVAMIGVSKRAWAAYMVMSVLGMLVFFAAPFFIAAYPERTNLTNVGLHTIAPLLPVLGLYYLGVVCSRAVRKRKDLGVGLSPDGVYYWTWFGSVFFAWEHIRLVRLASGRELTIGLDVAEPVDRIPNPEENWIGGWNLFRDRKTRLLPGYLAVNPAIVYYTMGFYYRHPELRHELSGQEGVDRIRKADFPDILAEVRRSGDFSGEGGRDPSS